MVINIHYGARYFKRDDAPPLHTCAATFFSNPFFFAYRILFIIEECHHLFLKSIFYKSKLENPSLHQPSKFSQVGRIFPRIQHANMRPICGHFEGRIFKITPIKNGLYNQLFAKRHYHDYYFLTRILRTDSRYGSSHFQIFIICSYCYSCLVK